LSEIKDFVDIIVPILEAGTWTNYGSTPKIISMNLKSSRGNKNARIEVKNEERCNGNNENLGNSIYTPEFKRYTKN